MSREFSSYDEAKQYYDDMVKVRKRYGEFNREIVNLKRQLEQDAIPLTQQRRNEIEQEMGAYIFVRDRIASTFQEKYEVGDIKKLAIKIREFKEELEQMERGNRWEVVHATQQDGQSNQGQEQPRKASHKELLDTLLKEHVQKDPERDKDRGPER